MIITAGLGHVTDYPAYVSAGAGEVFCGYVPSSWQEAYPAYPLNRREVRYAHVQIGGWNEMQILSSMQADLGVPVSLTFNSQNYLPEQYPLIAEIMEQCRSLGFGTFIIADPFLLFYLNHEGYDDLDFILSGDFGEINPALICHLPSLHVRRVIFHRHMGIQEMETCSCSCKELDYEAFALNERCHYTFCQSVHSDFLCHLCQVPFSLPNYSPEDKKSPQQDIPGGSGCGLCAIYDLIRAGVTHLKLVGRGNLSENMLQDIHILKLCTDTAAQAWSKEDYLRFLSSLFPEGCSGACYYEGFRPFRAL